MINGQPFGPSDLTLQNGLRPIRVRYFEEWIEKERLLKHGPLEFLKGSVIGIDAAYFAKQFLVEPLLTALGGSPIALEGFTNAVKNLKNAGIRLHFVFNGLQYARSEDAFATSKSINSQNNDAFTVYENQQPEIARRAFQKLGSFARDFQPCEIVTHRCIASQKLDEHMSTLKFALHDMDIPFTVAPYSALAQLAYYEKHPKQFVDAIYGPSELFCFGVDKVITDFTDVPKDDLDKVSINDHSVPLERLQFCWIDSASCLKTLGNIHLQVFTEALVLAGSDLFLKTFPPLVENANYKQAGVIRDAVNLLVAARGNVSQVCSQYPDASLKEIWLDKFKQTMIIIKHHVIITAEGEVESLEKAQAPIDTHLCIGLRLPEELYMYLSRGLIGTRVLNWLTRGEIDVPTPLAGSDTAICQRFVRGELGPLRQQATCLLTDGLHRYYQRAEYKSHFWFDMNIEEKFKPVDVSPSPRSQVSKWNVKKDALDKAKVGDALPGSLLFATRSLQDAEYAKQTITPKLKSDEALSTADEVLANTLWRVLQLRDFVTESHELTHWGKILERTLSAVGGQEDLQQAAYIAIELLRFEVLNLNSLFLDYPGSPARGGVNDKGPCMLVSRVASLGRLRHKPKGYSGPLSRSLLAYHSIVSALQTSLRDLLETATVSTFLEGGFARERDDWLELSRR
ncbi:uncharacterized protein KY384_004855 [Bacidia gigantensis]|uniref:uncharacterized protein n=1 Tax=Bacidia gigantensis TaxID=2732470 RepID=UPI001D04BAA1|nr:uncharacterized protein KY384_004855 [Bacidia gigantensis]KAG8530353.1 hypothetical protein KY384_004855 [Bacidia gigantensis]